MDMTFKCPHCEQELEVDSSATGAEIECPACGEALTVPALAEEEVTKAVDLNPISTSAAAKEIKHFAVPVHDKPADILITKGARPLEFSAKESDRQLRIRCIRRTECVEVGKDHFDEVVSAFLQKVGPTHLVSIHPITYTYMDMGTRQILTDYGAMIVYQG